MHESKTWKCVIRQLSLNVVYLAMFINMLKKSLPCSSAPNGLNSHLLKQGCYQSNLNVVYLFTCVNMLDFFGHFLVHLMAWIPISYNSVAINQV
jgi:hypothetical protein